VIGGVFGGCYSWIPVVGSCFNRATRKFHEKSKDFISVMAGLVCFSRCLTQICPFKTALAFKQIGLLMLRVQAREKQMNLLIQKNTQIVPSVVARQEPAYSAVLRFATPLGCTNKTVIWNQC